MAKKRANMYAKYIPLIAEFCTELAGKKKGPNFQKILDAEKASQPKLVQEENEIENK